MQSCTTCLQEKPEESFNWREKNVTRHKVCKDCHKKYRDANYRQNRDRRIKQASKRCRSWLEQNQRFIVQYLQSHPCVDCGETDILVLEFDHIEQRNSKGALVTNLLGCSRKRLETEMAKCEVRCANCHKRRTAEQINSYRLKYRSRSG